MQFYFIFFLTIVVYKKLILLHFIFLCEVYHYNVLENITRLETYLDECWEKRKVFVKKIDKFLYLINGEAKRHVDTFVSKDHTLDEYKHCIIKYHEISLAIPTDLSIESLGVFKVNFTDLIDILRQQARKFKNVIIAQMYSAYLLVGET